MFRTTEYQTLHTTKAFNNFNFSLPTKEIIKTYSVNATSQEDLIKTKESIEKMLTTSGMLPKQIMKIIHAIYELIENSQRHGYNFDKNKNVIVETTFVNDEYFLIGIQNGGTRLSSELFKKQMNVNPFETNGHGLGALYVKNASDQITINKHGEYTDIVIVALKDQILS